MAAMDHAVHAAQARSAMPRTNVSPTVNLIVMARSAVLTVAAGTVALAPPDQVATSLDNASVNRTAGTSNADLMVAGEAAENAPDWRAPPAAETVR